MKSCSNSQQGHHWKHNEEARLANLLPEESQKKLRLLCLNVSKFGLWDGTTAESCSILSSFSIRHQNNMDISIEPWIDSKSILQSSQPRKQVILGCCWNCYLNSSRKKAKEFDRYCYRDYGEAVTPTVPLERQSCWRRE